MTKLSGSNYNKLGKKELENLSTTARDLFHIINEYSELHNLRDKITVHFVVDQFQSIETDTIAFFFQLVCAQRVEYNNKRHKIDY